MARKAAAYKRSSQASSYRRYYSQSSAAQKIHADELAERRGKKEKKQPRKRGTLRYIYNFGTRSHSLAVYLVLGTIFIGCFACVSIYSFVWSASRSVHNLEAQLKSLQEYNATLEVGVSSSYDLLTIEKIATEKLQMSSPQPHQIVYISSPKENYIEQYKPISDIDTDVKLSAIKDFLFRKNQDD